MKAPKRPVIWPENGSYQINPTLTPGSPVLIKPTRIEVGNTIIALRISDSVMVQNPVVDVVIGPRVRPATIFQRAPTFKDLLPEVPFAHPEDHHGVFVLVPSYTSLRVWEELLDALQRSPKAIEPRVVALKSGLATLQEEKPQDVRLLMTLIEETGEQPHFLDLALSIYQLFQRKAQIQDQILKLTQVSNG